MSKNSATKRKLPSPARRRHARPIESDDFPILEQLFGANGACGGCWCMYWRVPSTGNYWAAHKGVKNKHAFRRLIETSEAHGAIAFEGDDPIGWCSYGPRDSFAYLKRSRLLPEPTIEGVWSITCFFIARRARMQGVSSLLLQTACTDVRQRGARYLEGYPSSAVGGVAAAAFVHTGLPGPFLKSGFSPVAVSGARTVMRKRL